MKSSIIELRQMIDALSGNRHDRRQLAAIRHKLNAAKARLRALELEIGSGSASAKRLKVEHIDVERRLAHLLATATVAGIVAQPLTGPSSACNFCR